VSQLDILPPVLRRVIEEFVRTQEQAAEARGYARGKEEGRAELRGGLLAMASLRSMAPAVSSPAVFLSAKPTDPEPDSTPPKPTPKPQVAKPIPVAKPATDAPVSTKPPATKTPPLQLKDQIAAKKVAKAADSPSSSVPPPVPDFDLDAPVSVPSPSGAKPIAKHPLLAGMPKAYDDNGYLTGSFLNWLSQEKQSHQHPDGSPKSTHDAFDKAMTDSIKQQQAEWEAAEQAKEAAKKAASPSPSAKATAKGMTTLYDNYGNQVSVPHIGSFSVWDPSGSEYPTTVDEATYLLKKGWTVTEPLFDQNGYKGYVSPGGKVSLMEWDGVQSVEKKVSSHLVKGLLEQGWLWPGSVPPPAVEDDEDSFELNPDYKKPIPVAAKPSGQPVTPPPPPTDKSLSGAPPMYDAQGKANPAFKKWLKQREDEIFDADSPDTNDLIMELDEAVYAHKKSWKPFFQSLLQDAPYPIVGPDGFTTSAYKQWEGQKLNDGYDVEFLHAAMDYAHQNGLHFAPATPKPLGKIDKLIAEMPAIYDAIGNPTKAFQLWHKKSLDSLADSDEWVAFTDAYEQAKQKQVMAAKKNLSVTAPTPSASAQSVVLPQWMTDTLNGSPPVATSSTPADGATKGPPPAGFPDDPGQLKFVKPLGGSTGAELHEDGTGRRFVVKRGASAAHVAAEASADAAYAAAGVAVPAVHLYAGGTKVSEYVDGVTLAEYMDRASTALASEMREKIARGFVVDALLGNWDVIGLSQDNIIVRPDGTPVRIDNGGSLGYRAQGERKKFYSWGGVVAELAAMRDREVNHSAAAIFDGLDDMSVEVQIRSLLPKTDEIIAAVGDPADQEVIRRRIESLKQWADDPSVRARPSSGGILQKKQHNPDLPDDCRPSVDWATQGHLRGYAATDYAALNDILRTGKSPSGLIGDMHATMSRMFDAVPVLDNPVPVQRFVGGSSASTRQFLAEAMDAKDTRVPISIPGYLSCSTAPSVKGYGNRKVAMLIDAVHGIDLNPYSEFRLEAEMLLPHDSVYHIDDVFERDGLVVVKMRQIPPSGSTTDSQQET